MAIRWTTVYCPHCEQKVDWRRGHGTVTYGSPVRKCRYCGTTYHDSGYVELALKPFSYYEERKQNNRIMHRYLVGSWVALLLAFAPAALWLLEDTLRWPWLANLGISETFALGSIIAGFVTSLIISVLMNRYHDRFPYVINDSFHSAYQASRKRLHDISYLEALRRMGYTVSAELVRSLEPQQIMCSTSFPAGDDHQ